MRAGALVATAVLLSAVFVGILLVPGLGASATVWVSDGGQLLAAVLAAAGCAVAAGRCRGPRRRAWTWLSIGTAAWACGQVVWSYYEIVLDQAVPFPSSADVGFLVFPLAATVGMVAWLGTQSHQLVARGRDLLDGAIIAGSLLLLSWVTTLGTVLDQEAAAPGGGASPFSLALSLAYPLGDLMLATLALLALARGTGADRTSLTVLTAGLGGLALADSSYVYLTSVTAYSSADLVTSGWVLGFLLVGAAGLCVEADHQPLEQPSAPVDPAVARPLLVRVCLPYLPLVAAGAALCVDLLTARFTPTVDLMLGVGLVALVLTRQFMSILDNQQLLAALGQARDQLQHQALHDPLTGLANRVLFADRLDRALLQPAASVSVLFCDLDDFKSVNDQLGHGAGDDLLELVATRLLECVRLTDTVARLGGDEFAILLADTEDALEVAHRVVASVGAPSVLAGREWHTTISVGIAHHLSPATAGFPEHRRDEVRSRALGPSTVDVSQAARTRDAPASQLLRHADTAMYAAKGAGKSRVVLSDVG